MIHHPQTTITAESGKQEIVITRKFDAPRELVFKAFSDPHLILQWWGPDNFQPKLKGQNHCIHETKGEQ